MDNFGFLKVAAAVPQVRVADCEYNSARIVALAEEAARRGVEIVAFPELAVTGYTCGDLLLQSALLDAADAALEEIVRATRKLPLTLLVGAPLRHGSTLYNCAVVFTQGRVLGVVPKTHIPDYAEFYENRWFASGAGIAEEERIAVAGQQTDFGTGLTFEVNGTEFGVEICEDLWTAIPPSSQLALNGAKVLFNLSASPEGVGKHAYLRQLVAQQSARTLSAYVYCSAGQGESSSDLVFAGNGFIAETASSCAKPNASRPKNSSSWPTWTSNGSNSSGGATPRSATTKRRRKTPSSRWKSPKGCAPRRSTATSTRCRSYPRTRGTAANAAKKSSASRPTAWPSGSATRAASAP